MGYATRSPFAKYSTKQVRVMLLTGDIFREQLCHQTEGRFALGATVQANTFGTLSYHSGFRPVSLDFSEMAQAKRSGEMKNTGKLFMGTCVLLEVFLWLKVCYVRAKELTFHHMQGSGTSPWWERRWDGCKL